MRVARTYLWGLSLALLPLLAASCQSAKKPISAVPHTTAPAATSSRVEQTSASPKESVPQPPQKVEPAKNAEVGAPVSDPSPAPSNSDAAADLIAQAQQEYKAGLEAYQAGQGELAKEHFDHAFNSLLGSNLDIRSDERLQKEFDIMVEGVNHLDLNGLTPEAEAQKSEPAPIDETNGITPAADPNVKAKAQAEIKSTHSDLPLMMTDQVAGFISYFSNRGRGTFERAFARSGRYHDMMISILKQEGVPQDLIYLAQAESGFHPLAVSRAGARGIWQFMGSRAKGYGLQRNVWADDRQDPEKSTRAAARHLKDLYAQFGDWYLAMAAYNSGPGTVQAAVRRTGYADFWELYRRNVLPKETRNYVPIILAVTIMAKNLSHYGFDDVSMDEPATYDTVSIGYAVDLRLVAECVNSTAAKLQELNPRLLRLTTPKDGKFELHLPTGAKEQYQSAIAAIPTGMRLWWRYPTMREGDTLASLARSYRTTAKAIVAVNHLDGPEPEAGSRLIIPVEAGKHPASDNATYARRITRYKVRGGDTVETVAENFGVSAQMLRRWNGLHGGDSLRGRKVLALHLPITPDSEVSTAKSKSNRHTSKLTPTAATKVGEADSTDTPETPAPLHHKVKSGETLYSIATAYNTTVAALKRANGNIATLRPGMILVVRQSR